ncbi:MAG: DinB family protein [Actinomycetota bacterium]
MTAGPAEAFVERLEAARARLERLAGAEPAPGALTDADEPTGERWEWGQVWAHLAEFPGYWMARLREVFASAARDRSGEPPPFGRTSTDPGRIAAIERDRDTPPERLMVRLRGDLDDLRELLAEMSPADWELHVRHPTLGVLDAPRVFETFLVGHLEAHAGQLESLLGR